MEDRLSPFNKLIEEFNNLPPDDVVEPSIFSIGSKGYYENPTTDILAFFFNGNGPHDLDSPMLRALLECLPSEYHELDPWLKDAPEREVTTKTGKRIDLLLEGHDWVMVLENKIYHEQNNPFEYYENFIQIEEKLRFDNKRKVFVILSLNGDNPPAGWYGISYTSLISSIKKLLAQQFIDQPISKWILLLREFILHLESLMSLPSVNQQTLDFVLDNVSTIKALQKLKQQAINEYHHRLQMTLQEKLNQDISILLHHWDGSPALRFKLNEWENSESDVVLLLSGNGGRVSFSVFASISNDQSKFLADSLILKDVNHEKGLESLGKIRRYKIKEAKLTEKEIIGVIQKCLSELNEYEQRSKGANN